VANGWSGCSEALKNQDWQITDKFAWNRSMKLWRECNVNGYVCPPLVPIGTQCRGEGRGAE